MPSIKARLFAVIANPIARRVFLALAVALAVAPAIYRSYGIFRSDRIFRSEPTVNGYSNALKYDPSNATLWWHRGRLRHYTLGTPNIAKAAEDYQHALSLNPRLSQAWVDLSDCFDRMGKLKEAEEALERAIAVHRYSPLIRWQAGNFFLRRGNLPKMYECFKLASQYDNEKLDIAIEIAWKIDSDHEGILQKLIPNTLHSYLKYLNFLAAQDELDLAGRVWHRCLGTDVPADFVLKPASVFFYIDHLLARLRIDEALHVWNDILRKTRSGFEDMRLRETLRASESNSGNLIWNGSFENQILGGGFDWRYQDSPGVQFRIDTNNRMHGLKSLQVQFGDVNISSIFFYQIVPILEPGPYQLDFYLRTEGLTTDQTPFIAIQRYRDEGGAAARSVPFPATTAWSKISVPFTANKGCKAVLLTLQRNKSSKFDNQIKGSLWLDGFALRSSTPQSRDSFFAP
jgi:tetratricopeptide (TPR) repeat protein